MLHPITVYRDHYADVIMSTMASQITILTIVYSTVYCSVLLAFVRGIYIPRTKGQ